MPPIDEEEAWLNVRPTNAEEAKIVEDALNSIQAERSAAELAALRMADLDCADSLLAMMLAKATDGDAATGDYRNARAALLETRSFPAQLLPRVVRSQRDPASLRQFMQSQDTTYAGRRKYLREAFAPLLDYLEKADSSPADAAIGEAVAVLDSEAVRVQFARMLERRTSDPEAAITSARALVESVCKTILDDRGQEYDAGLDLPKLYAQTADVLNLSPDDRVDNQIKAILTALKTLVQSLGALRNRGSDAHGQGRKSYKLTGRHAGLAVHAAGTIATFLIETHEEQRTRSR